jgi:putative endopeptidase
MAESLRDLRFSSSDLNREVAPGDDFYEFANGGWCRANPIPEDYSRWGTFMALDRKNQEQLRELLEEAQESVDAPPGSPCQLVGDWYAAAMNEAAIEAAGWQPVRSLLEAIEAADSVSALGTLCATLEAAGIQPFFELGVQQDARDSQRMIGVLYQGGLGLPEREYYLDPEPFFENARAAYLRFLIRLLELWRGPDSGHEGLARQVIGFERELALVSMTPSEQRDPHAIYHPWTVAGLVSEVPEVAWHNLFSAHRLPAEFPLNLAQPAFFRRMGRLVVETEPRVLKAYLSLRLLSAASPLLSSAWVENHFAWVQALTGAKTLQPRWLRVARALDPLIGFALGQLYVKRYFPAASRDRTRRIFENVRATFRDRMEHLSWMSPPTRQRALEKLDRMTTRIGYPDRFRDYEGLVIDRRSYWGNAVRAASHALGYDLSKIGQTPDPEEWFMTPQTVNAYYHPSRNEMVFPAGILQPPFFDPDMPEAYNYGAIGAVIGHEMTHGFDDQGRKYDALGNLVDWWTGEDENGFRFRIERLRDQLAGVRVEGGHPLNPELLMGEFIADIGGVSLAFEAMQRAGAGPGFGGFSEEQLFFLAFAHLWAGEVRQDAQRLLLATDPHPPAVVRVNQTLKNIPAFGRAFALGGGEPLYPDCPVDPWGGVPADAA